MVGVVLAGDGRRRVLHLPGDLLLGGLFPMHEQVRQRQRQTQTQKSSPWWTPPNARASNIRAGAKKDTANSYYPVYASATYF